MVETPASCPWWDALRCVLLCLLEGPQWIAPVAHSNNLLTDASVLTLLPPRLNS